MMIIIFNYAQGKNSYFIFLGTDYG